MKCVMMRIPQITCTLNAHAAVKFMMFRSRIFLKYILQYLTGCQVVLNQIKSKPSSGGFAPTAENNTLIILRQVILFSQVPSPSMFRGAI